MNTTYTLTLCFIIARRRPEVAALCAWLVLGLPAVEYAVGYVPDPAAQVASIEAATAAFGPIAGPTSDWLR